MSTQIEDLIAGSEPDGLEAPDVERLRARGRRRRVVRRGLQASGTLAVAAAVALGVTVLPSPSLTVDPLGSGGSGTAAGDAAAAPWQVLPTAEGWAVEVLEVRQEGGTPVSGEYAFARLAAHAEIQWSTGDSRDELVASGPDGDARVVEDATVLGHNASVIVGEQAGLVRAVWFDGERTFHVRAFEVDRSGFDEFLASLEVVHDAVWQEVRSSVLAGGTPVADAEQRMPPAPTAQSWRLLVDDPDWRLVRAAATDAGDGMVDAEITFSTDVGALPEVSVTAMPGFTEPTRAADGEVVGSRPVVGQQATLLQEGDLEHHAVWFDGFHTIVVRMTGVDQDGRDQLLDALVVADDTSWSAALPADVLAAAELAVHVEAALAALPVRSALSSDDIWTGGPAPTLQLDSRVALQVACDWVASWDDARANGDAEAARTAGESVEQVRAWAEDRLDPTVSGVPQVLRQYGDAIGQDGTGDGVIVGGTASTVEGTFRDALGC